MFFEVSQLVVVLKAALRQVRELERRGDFDEAEELQRAVFTIAYAAGDDVYEELINYESPTAPDVAKELDELLADLQDEPIPAGADR